MREDCITITIIILINIISFFVIESRQPVPSSSISVQQQEERIQANKANAALFDPIKRAEPDSTSKDPFANIGM